MRSFGGLPCNFAIKDDSPVHACGKLRVMGCDDKCAALGESDQALGDVVCGFGVEMGGRLIRKYDAALCIAGGAGDGDAQGFASGHSYAAIAKRTTSVAAGEAAELCE